jgi:putative secretion ATPase (PEP-CTERM system associated)
MYEEYFSLSSPPFRLAPDPRFFFGSRSHNKAMAYLHYGLRQAEGFIVITGEIGAGKSMLIGHLLDQLNRSNISAAHLLTPNLQPDELLAHILSAFRIEPSNKGKTAEIEAFEDYLFDQMNRGKRVLLIVDEAQNLPPRTLEELRILSNMEYQGTPLFQVFLVGQPDFRDVLARSDMEQLRQRIIATYHLEALSKAETENYIRHRLQVAGWSGKPAVAPDAFESIFAATGGLPRKINKLCTRVFLLAALEKRQTIDRALVAAAQSDLENEGRPSVEPANDRDRPDADHQPSPSVAPEPLLAVEEPPAEVVVIEATPEPPPFVAPPPAAAIAIETPVRAAAPEPAPEVPGSQPVMKEKPAIPTVAPAAMTLFDRLKAAKSGEPVETMPAPQPATLDDVAEAIAAVKDRAASPAPAAAPAFLSLDAAPHAEPEVEAEEASAPPLPNGPASGEAWKRAVVASINETRDELQLARQNVAKIRRRLSDLDKSREMRRSRLVESLDRAQSILSDLGDQPRN